jgi:SAM-dependent methyltransferase
MISMHDEHATPKRAEPKREHRREADPASSNQVGGTTFDRDIPSESRSQASTQQSISGNDFDKAYTSGRPPWNIDRPQPAFVKLAQTGRITGKVLDVGCGTGETALFLAQRALDVLGLDISSVAIAEAMKKAQERRVTVRFLVGSAMDLPNLEETFDTAIDSGLLHVLSDADRARFVVGLHTILRPGGYLHLLAFNEHATWPGPRRLTQVEIRTTFAQGWEVEAIGASHFEVVDGSSGAEAWLASIRRLPALLRD